MEYRIEQLDEHTWLIEEYEDQISVYMYLLEGERQAILIDTGMGTIPLDEICRKLTSKEIMVLLTHGHVDHIGGTNLFEQVYLERSDLPAYRLHSGELRKQFYRGGLPPVKQEVKFMKGGDIFDLGGRMVEVIAVPGHSLGSVCFLDKERKWLFSGDTCCRAHVLLQMDYSAPIAAYLDSVNQLIARKNEFVLTWPGHHSKPVKPDILYQFREAAEGLLAGTMQGEDFAVGGKDVKLIAYQDIGIEYK